MGTPIQPNPTGDECLYWDPPSETPEKMYAMFWGVKKGDMGGAFEPPNGHIFTLHQNDITACLWEHLCSGFGWQVQLGIQIHATWIDLVDCVHANAHYFGRTLDLSPPPEYQTFTNWYAHPFGNYGYNGFAVIFWLEKVITLVKEFGWDHVADLMLETFPIDAVDYVLKFCSHEIRANIKIRITP